MAKKKKEKTEYNTGFVSFHNGKPYKEGGKIVIFYGEESDIKRHAKGEMVKYAKVGIKTAKPDIIVKDVEKETTWKYVEPVKKEIKGAEKNAKRK